MCPTVKILDFGLAARRTLAASGDLTLSGDDGAPAWTGTPAFMAPEQADGDPASEASDIFALGLIIFELLTGARAFAGDNVLQVLRAIRGIEPDRLVALLDEPFATLLRRMLAPDPRTRRIRMREVVDMLQSPSGQGGKEDATQSPGAPPRT